MRARVGVTGSHREPEGDKERSSKSQSGSHREPERARERQGERQLEPEGTRVS